MGMFMEAFLFGLHLRGVGCDTVLLISCPAGLIPKDMHVHDSTSALRDGVFKI